MNNIRNGYREEKSFCYFHPKQVLIGVCPLCLNERLLLLAAKQGRNRSSSSSSRRRKPPSSIHKIFAFRSLFTRPRSHHSTKSHNYHHHYDYDDVSPTPEESFISIKFEENGVASWEKSTVSKVTLENCNSKMLSWNHQNKDKGNNKSVIEHGKSRDTFRWRKRIGHMFQLIRWNKSAGVCHVGTKVEGVKVTKGWMRTLTKRKTTME